MGAAIGTDIILPPCLTHMGSGDPRTWRRLRARSRAFSRMSSGSPRTISSGDAPGEKASVPPIWCPPNWQLQRLDPNWKGD